MKKILIAGGGHAEISLIKAAKALGYYVITSGNCPAGLGHKYSDQNELADFSDRTALLEIARRERVLAICPGANDFSIISTSYVAEKLGLPGHDSYQTTLTLHHKDRYRRLAEEAGLPVPHYCSASSVDEGRDLAADLRFPFLAKPIDMSGGKGISKVCCRAEVEQAVAHAIMVSKSGRIVLEEFVEGTRHGFSALIHDDRIIFHFVDNEHYYKNPYLVGGASGPIQLSEGVISRLRIDLEKISRALKLRSGLLHVQFILRPDHIPVILEICRRPPGDLYLRLVELATGTLFSENIIRSFAGAAVQSVSVGERRFFSRHCIMASCSGIFVGLHLNPLIKGRIVEKLMFMDPKGVISNHMVQKIGIVFVQFSSAEEMAQLAPQMNELIKVEMKV